MWTFLQKFPILNRMLLFLCVYLVLLLEFYSTARANYTKPKVQCSILRISFSNSVSTFACHSRHSLSCKFVQNIFFYYCIFIYSRRSIQLFYFYLKCQFVWRVFIFNGFPRHKKKFFYSTIFCAAMTITYTGIASLAFVFCLSVQQDDVSRAFA